MSAVHGAILGWNTADFVPQRDKPYGDVELRRSRYLVAESYYNNSIYDSLNKIAPFIKREERLYKFIRGISNPVDEVINLFSSYAYKGTIDTAELKGGSLPLRFDNTQLEEPLKQVIKWSNLDQALGRYVKDAALLGDAAWWIVDDPLRRRVRLELVDPAKIKLVERDEVGNVKAVVFECMREEEPEVERYQPSRSGTLQLRSPKSYRYTLKVTKEKYQTFKDNEPFAFHADANGNLLAEWDNIFGFVPLKLAYYTHGKDSWGQNCFFGTPRRLIDELNDQASIINDAIRNVVVPLLQAPGVTSKDQITVDRNERDNLTIIYLPKETELKGVSIPLDITAASANRSTLVSELRAKLPVLSLQLIRQLGTDLSGVAIQNLFGDAVATIEQLRKNLDPALVGALQMAATIGGIQGYDGFASINASSFDRGEMELSIAQRPVIDDRLAQAERVDKLVVIAPLPEGTKRKALEEMGYDKKDIEDVITADKAETATKQPVAIPPGQPSQTMGEETPPSPPEPSPNGDERQPVEEAIPA